jgi:D-tagatose-1,6-bisphosphate aldolase subunit GatZ/KbaZ
MKLADDECRHEGNIPDKVVAERAAFLCAACEDQWEKTEKNTVKPVYIVGTEVPVPGGTDSENEELDLTSPAEAEETLRVTEHAFSEKGLSKVWDRVIALVVQPGVEFGESDICDYDKTKAAGLSRVIKNYPGMVFEAHSTDYQTGENLKNMVEDHFAILKVGPWLTFAYREALFLLSEIEKEVMGQNNSECSFLKETLLEVMMEQPKHWKNYYTGTDAEIEYKLKYSLSDRSRYYWSIEKVDSAVKILINNLNRLELPLPLLSQYFPEEYNLLRLDKLDNSPEAIIINRIMNVINKYSNACGCR